MVDVLVSDICGSVYKVDKVSGLLTRVSYEQCAVLMFPIIPCY